MRSVAAAAKLSRRGFCLSAISAAAALALPRWSFALEQRNEVGFLRGPYNLAFYKRHNPSYRIGAAMHFFHSKEHDLLHRTPLAEHTRYDKLLNDKGLAYMRDPPRTEPEMDYYSEYIDRAMHTLFRAIDWTHVHHEQTYDIMSCPDIPWSERNAGPTAR